MGPVETRRRERLEYTPDARDHGRDRKIGTERRWVGLVMLLDMDKDKRKNEERVRVMAGAAVEGGRGR